MVRSIYSQSPAAVSAKESKSKQFKDLFRLAELRK